MMNQGIDEANEINLHQELDRQEAGNQDFLDESDSTYLKKEKPKMPKTIEIEVKAKIGALEIPKTFSYEEPENWGEAISMSENGEASEFKVYLIKRKTNFMDKKRSGMVKDATKKLGALSIEKLREMGLDI